MAVPKSRMRVAIFFVLVFSILGCQKFVTEEIDLNYFSSSIDISPSANSVILTKGTYTYTLTKKEALNGKRYLVGMTDILSFTSSHLSAPEDEYSRTMEIIPADDKRARRSMAILPANESVRDISRQIKEGDTIKVFGSHFRHSQVIHDGRKEPLTHCLSILDVFYITELEIE